MSRVPRRNGDSDTFNSYRNDLDSRERRDWSPEWDMADRDEDRDRERRVNRIEPYYAADLDDSRRPVRRDRDDYRREENRRPEWNERRDRASFGGRNWRDRSEDNWTGRSRGDEYRQEDFESLRRYQWPGGFNETREGRDSERWGYGRQAFGPGFEDRGQFSPMNRYGWDYGRQSFQGYGQHPREYGQRAREEYGQQAREGYGQSFGRERTHAGVGPKNWKRSDERIKDEVCESLAAHPEIDASDTDIHVKDAVVTLTGTVRDRRTRRMMEDVVDSIPGVADVECQLKVDEKTKAGMMGGGEKAPEKDRAEKNAAHAGKDR